MRKEDLQNGMIVKFKDGRKYVVQNEKLIHEYSYCELDGYKDNLTSNYSSGFDIVEIYKTVDLKSPKYFFDDEYLELIWERPARKNFSATELSVLRRINPKWKWLTKDSSGDMTLYSCKPRKNNNNWFVSNWFDEECFGGFDHLFECISSDDIEPLYIDDYVLRTVI